MSKPKPAPFTPAELRACAVKYAGMGVPWTLALTRAETELRAKAKCRRVRSVNGQQPVYIRREDQ